MGKDGWERERRHLRLSFLYYFLSICFNNAESGITIYVSCQRQGKWNLRFHKKRTAEKGRRNTGIDTKIKECNNNGNTCTIYCYQVQQPYNKHYISEACVSGVDLAQFDSFWCRSLRFSFGLLCTVNVLINTVIQLKALRQILSISV